MDLKKGCLSKIGNGDQGLGDVTQSLIPCLTCEILWSVRLPRVLVPLRGSRSMMKPLRPVSLAMRAALIPKLFCAWMRAELPVKTKARSRGSQIIGFPVKRQFGGSQEFKLIVPGTGNT